MRLRIIAGLVLLPVLPLVLYFAPDWTLPTAIAIVSAVGVYELLGATGYVTKKRLIVYGMLLAAIIPFWFYFGPGSHPLLNRFYAGIGGLFVFTLLLFLEAIIDHRHVTFSKICVVLVTGLFIPLFFSSLVRIALMPNGRHYIMIPFVCALLGDTCAYFVGVFFGKHKLKPDISPKKTIEGAVGGVAGVLCGLMVYGLIEQLALGVTVHYGLLLVYGLLGAVAGIVGDLSLSLIKREFHIKDFGNILPGHGGVMDRLDSVLFAAPVCEILILLLPAFGFPAL